MFTMTNLPLCSCSPLWPILHPYLPKHFSPPVLVQYCLFGPNRGSLAVMPAADAIRQNIAEAKKTVPHNYWITVGLACSERDAKAVRRTIHQELNGQNQGNP